MLKRLIGTIQYYWYYLIALIQLKLGKDIFEKYYPKGKEWRMKKQLLVIYDTDTELHGLTVVDLEEKLPNGNNKVIKVLIGDYADEIYKELTEDTKVW